MKRVIGRLKAALLYKGERSFWRRFLGNFKSPLFWIFFIAGWLAGHELSELGVFEYAALHTNDALMREAAQTRAETSNLIRIVNITPEDFASAESFQSKLPLLTEPLSRAVCSLVNRSPRALIVDLDTSDASFASMPLPQNPKVPVIWARGAVPSTDPDRLVPKQVLGNRDLPRGQFTGLAVNFLSLDWSVREYPRWMKTTARERASSLHWQAYCLLKPRDPHCAEHSRRAGRNLETPSFERFIAFVKYPVGEFLDGAPATAAEACRTKKIDDSRIAGQIIIVGGSYSECDSYKTPFGDRPGAEIVASALEEELNPRRSHLMGLEQHLWEVALVLLIVTIHSLLRPVPALAATAGLLTLLVWQGVWLAFHYGSYRASVVPFLIAIVTEQMLVAAERAQHLAHDVEGLEVKLKRAAKSFLSLSNDASALADHSVDVEASMSARDIADAATKFAEDSQWPAHPKQHKG